MVRLIETAYGLDPIGPQYIDHLGYAYRLFVCRIVFLVCHNVAYGAPAFRASHNFVERSILSSYGYSSPQTWVHAVVQLLPSMSEGGTTLILCLGALIAMLCPTLHE